jgi:hypothetical protein
MTDAQGLCGLAHCGVLKIALESACNAIDLSLKKTSGPKNLVPGSGGG